MSLPWKAGFATMFLLSAVPAAVAQMTPAAHGSMAASMDSGHMMMGNETATSGEPTAPGQDAFGAIQEIVKILEADSSTDWSKVNIAALREHLIDMNEVTLHADAVPNDIENGVEITITGQGRTVDAIKRMVPEHALDLNQMGWSARTANLPNGVTLTVTTADSSKLPELRALGFMGIMVLGADHQRHHLMMAKGEMIH